MMTKRMAALGLGLLLASGWAFADAIATSVTGNAQVGAGTSSARVLRTGDAVRQGDTVSTGPNSSTVLKFDDGQVAAIPSNSRLTVTAYTFDPVKKDGNVVLTVLSGGLRAVSGLIGRLAPQKVNYRAASATIGIRGTDVTIVTVRGDVVVTVEEGFISFTFAGQTITVPAGQGVNAKADGTFQTAAAAQIINQVPADVRDLINGLQGLQAAITTAANAPVAAEPQPPNPTISTPSSTSSTGTGGGGSASIR